MVWLALFSLYRSSHPEKARLWLTNAISLSLFPQGLGLEQLERWQARFEEQRADNYVLEGIALSFHENKIRDLEKAGVQALVLGELKRHMLERGGLALATKISDRALRSELLLSLEQFQEKDLSRVIQQKLFPQGISDEQRELFAARLAEQERLQLLPEIALQFSADDINLSSPTSAANDISQAIANRLMSFGLDASADISQDGVVTDELRHILQDDLAGELDERLASVLFREEPNWFEDLQARLEQPKEIIPGVYSQVEGDIRQYLPQELARVLLKDVAQAVYDGRYQQDPNRYLAVEVQERLEANIGVFGQYGQQLRQQSRTWLRNISFLAVFCLLMVLIFASGFAKISSIALSLVLASLPGLGLTFFLQQSLQQLSALNAPDSLDALGLWNYLGQLASYLASFLPHGITEIYHIHLAAFAAGLLLLFISFTATLRQLLWRPPRD